MKPDDDMRAAPSLGNRDPAPVYSRALLCYDDPVAVDERDGREPVEAKAKDMAAKRLAQLAARKATKIAAKAAAPVLVRPTPAPAHALPTRRQPRHRARHRSNYATGCVPRSCAGARR